MHAKQRFQRLDAGADRVELVRNVAREHAEANSDHGDNDAGDHGVFQRRHGAAVGLQSGPGLDLCEHFVDPLLSASVRTRFIPRWSRRSLSSRPFAYVGSVF